MKIFDAPKEEIVLDSKIKKLENFIRNDWAVHLNGEFKLDYFRKIEGVLSSSEFYPSIESVFCSINGCAISDVKVVILGQDPYHNQGQAMGLAFSVPKICKIPPSLKNIFKELKTDIQNFRIPQHGDLTKWTEQGVLLLNDTLTVKPNQPSSHSKIGWKIFTDKILKIINENNQNVVFMLWGNHARQKAKLIDKSKHLILESGHPSPLSVKKFFGCKHFSMANEYLKQHCKEIINWEDL